MWVCIFKFDNFSWLVPPKVTPAERVVGAPYGQKTVLECTVRAFPRPIVYWNNTRGWLASVQFIQMDTKMPKRIKILPILLNIWFRFCFSILQPSRHNLNYIALSFRDDSRGIRREIRSVRDSALAVWGDVDAVAPASGASGRGPVQLRGQELSQRRAVSHQSVQWVAFLKCTGLTYKDSARFRFLTF